MNQTYQDPGRVEEISRILEPLIRRIIREELTRLVKAEPGTFYLDPDMPLYKDMEVIFCLCKNGAPADYDMVSMLHFDLQKR